ncbi:MAG TPA: DUF6029 family protein [Flavobacteriales bacterium]
MASPFRTLLLLGSAALGTSSFAQEGQVHGNFSADGQLYNDDTDIGAEAPPQTFALNSWMNLQFTKGPFSAGGRFEVYQPALLGYPAGSPYKGSGVGYRYASYSLADLDVTIGNFYEQFGQGLIFRSYEERYLGVDNAMDGVRVKYKPYRGVYLKGFAGQQRGSFDNGLVNGTGILRGFDAEVSLNELLDSLWTHKWNLIVGGSFVSKYQQDQDPLYVIPENVGAYSGRLNLVSSKWNIYTEYAYKVNDPNSKNGYIYKPGQAYMVNATYSTKGLGISAGTHAFDNMFFQSRYAAPSPFDLNVNFLPPLAKQHTYNLPATLYPYATQPNGEIAHQAEVFYKFKKGSALGGKYGTKIAVNYSVAYGLDSTRMSFVTDSTRTGYRTNDFFGALKGERQYFSDFNVELRKKVSEKWELALTYINLVYDIEVIQGKAGKPVIFGDMFILEGLHSFNDRNSLRFEAQHLSTKQDLGNWATAVAEFTFSPHWFLAAQDQYNYGGSVKVDELHYPIGSVGYIRGGNRFQFNYGRQRAGIFCVGGVCRQVPAANGLTVSVTSTF